MLNNNNNNNNKTRLITWGRSFHELLHKVEDRQPKRGEGRQTGQRGQVLQKDFAQQGGGAGSSLLHGCLFTWKENI